MKRALAVALLIPGVLFADGGTLLFSQRAGPFVVTAFSSPVPVRVGNADLSVMAQDAGNNDVVLDASVTLRLSKPGEQEIVVKATRAQATNKALYAANVEFPSAGEWQLEVDVKENGRAARSAGKIDVLPPEAPLFAYWPYFVALPIAVFLFALNQWLKKKRRIRRPQARP